MTLNKEIEKDKGNIKTEKDKRNRETKKQTTNKRTQKDKKRKNKHKNKEKLKKEKDEGNEKAEKDKRNKKTEKQTTNKKIQKDRKRKNKHKNKEKLKKEKDKGNERDKGNEKAEKDKNKESEKQTTNKKIKKKRGKKKKDKHKERKTAGTETEDRTLIAALKNFKSEKETKSTGFLKRSIEEPVSRKSIKTADEVEATIIDIPKRLKDSRIGSIVEMTVYNWMVYSGPVKIISGDGINLVVAANASGKSSLVCAIVFGLGYTSSVLSRSKNLKDFIKKGEKKSYIEILLKKDNRGTLRIKRKMLVQGNNVHSIWLLDNKEVGNREIEEMQKQYNINIDNLITFLPQENVSKFASLNPAELFENTLEAIDRHLLEEYKMLQQLLEECRKDRRSLDMYMLEQQAEESIVTNLEKRKEELRHYFEMRASRELYEMQRDSLLIKKKKDDLKNYKNEIQELKKQRDECITKMKPFSEELQQCKKTINTITHDLDTFKRRRNECNALYVRSNMIYQQLDTNILNHIESFGSFLNSVKIAAKSITSLRKELHELRNNRERIIVELEQIENNQNEQLQKKRDRWEKEMSAIRSELSTLRKEEKKISFELEKKVKVVQTKKNLEEIQEKNLFENIEEKRKQRIMNYKMNIQNIISKYDLIPKERVIEIIQNVEKMNPVVGVIEEMTRMLIKELASQNIIYGPLCKYIRSTKEEYAYLLEYFLKNILDHFLLVDSSRKKFQECLYNEYKLTLITASNKTPTFCTVTEEMKARGVICFLHELFECIPVIKNNIAQVVTIHTTFIVKPSLFKDKSTKEIEEFSNFMIDQISKQLGNNINQISYFKGNTKHEYRLSTYNRKVFSDRKTKIPDSVLNENQMKNRRVLVTGNHTDRKFEEAMKEHAELKEKCEQIKRKIKETNTEYLKKEEEGREYRTKESNKIMLEVKKEKLKERIAYIESKMEREIIKEESIDKKRNEIVKNVIEQNEKKLELFITFFDCVNREIKSSNPLHSSTKKLNILERYMHKVRGNLIEYTAKEKTLRVSIEECEKKVKTEDALIHHMMNKLEARKKSLNREQRQTLHYMINGNEETIEEIEKKINQIISQEGAFELIHSENQKIESLEENLEKHKTRLQTIKLEYEKIKKNIERKEEEVKWISSSWSEQVEEYISFLNYNFSSFMNFINENYDGKIELVKRNESYENCELYIKVRFKKDAEFQYLKVSHQSGGERSLVTMLFILTIHKITKNGFYVLDELNQGLDSVNERQIFKLLSYISNPDTYKIYFFDPCPYVYTKIKIDLCSKPQFFIFTPQLIKGISFHDITVHFLFNGFGVLNFDQFSDLNTLKKK